MCGIAGIYAPGQRAITAAVRVMIQAMAHRGPDDEGIETINGGELVLGHRRLSILDLSASGHQPMAAADGKTWIVFNGEIYNFREIRTELKARGCSFRSNSDTEVILVAYRQWGLDAISRLRGMFAFALWDGEKRLLHLCRDRFGVKPLYFAVKGGYVAFASESKALNLGGHTLKVVDPVSVAEFVQYGYISAPCSIFRDVEVVPPGRIVTFDATLQRFDQEFWSARELFDGEEAESLRQELSMLPEDALLDRLEAALQKAFEYRMVADVPVGLFLSGGIDSSLVATLLARRSGIKLRTFTIGYSASEFDESTYARTVANTLGADHVEHIVSPLAALDLMHEATEIADEPIGDSSLIPTLMVSKLARQHVKVALSADGADELFGGYARYAFCGDFVNRRSRFVHSLYRLSGHVLEQLPPKLIASAYAIARRGGPKFAAINDKLRKFVRMSQASDGFGAYDAAICEWSARESRRLLVMPSTPREDAVVAFKSVSGADVRDQFMHFDLIRYLPGDLLTKVDRASMHVSLEAREPFLDHEMARLAAALPITWKIRGSQNKYLLRRLLCRYFPSEMFDRPKQGFSAPVADWLRGPLRDMLCTELSPARVRQFGLLDPQAVGHVTDGFLAGRRGSSAAGVWFLLQLQRWAGRWLAHERTTAPATGLLDAMVS